MESVVKESLQLIDEVERDLTRVYPESARLLGEAKCATANGRPQDAVEILMTALESAMNTVNSQSHRLSNLRQLVQRLGTHVEADRQQGLWRAQPTNEDA